MNRNTFLIVVVAVIVIIGLTWIFNRGARNDVDPFGPNKRICTASIEQDGQTYCTSMIIGYPMGGSSSAEGQQ